MFSPCSGCWRSLSHLVLRRKAWDLNPYLLAEARISSAARRTVSGYLPFVCKWTHRESNPDCQSAELESSRWTMSPRFQVDLMGVEPTTPTLQGSVASSGMQAHPEVGGGNRTRSPSLPRRYAAGTPTDHLGRLHSGSDVNRQSGLNCAVAHASTRK